MYKTVENQAIEKSTNVSSRSLLLWTPGIRARSHTERVIAT
jgi:hypothetical protein